LFYISSQLNRFEFFIKDEIGQLVTFESQLEITLIRKKGQLLFFGEFNGSDKNSFSKQAVAFSPSSSFSLSLSLLGFFLICFQKTLLN
jgi:hypothetical protein